MNKKNTQLVHEIRAPKSREELANIVLAQRIAERVLGDTLKILKTGITELEVANFIKKSFVKYNAPILSFEPIVSFGKNTANIHHEPSKAKLKVGDTIMFDFGTTVKHYCSDMTRTYFWGEPNAKQKKVYSDVLKAMDLAFAKLEKGEKKCRAIDKSARAYLDKIYPINKSDPPAGGFKKGERYDGFNHGLGHGVGTVIHEWPSFKPDSEDILPAGCVMTVEPGVYLKGFGGVRIEDMVLVTKNGYKNLTAVPKDLKSIILKPNG